MPISRARKIAQRGGQATKRDIILSNGDFSVSTCKAYQNPTALPVTGNDVGDMAFVWDKATDKSKGRLDFLYVWIGNSETDLGGWYKVKEPLEAA